MKHLDSKKKVKGSLEILKNIGVIFQSFNQVLALNTLPETSNKNNTQLTKHLITCIKLSFKMYDITTNFEDYCKIHDKSQIKLLQKQSEDFIKSALLESNI